MELLIGLGSIFISALAGSAITLALYSSFFKSFYIEKKNINQDEIKTELFELALNLKK